MLSVHRCELHNIELHDRRSLDLRLRATHKCLGDSCSHINNGQLLKGLHDDDQRIIILDIVGAKTGDVNDQET
jgi:hypothetical protein